MTILDRYFLKEFLKPFGACLFAFLLVMVVLDLFDNINDFISAETSLSIVLQYYFILLPNWIVLIMPLTLLLALLYVLSRMSRNGELTAMRAAGLNFFRLMAPYFVLGLCMSMQMLSLKIGWAPLASQNAKLFFIKHTSKKKDDPLEKASHVRYHDITGNRFWYIHSLDPSQGIATDVEIIQSDESNRDKKSISARYGLYQDGHWILKNVLIYDYTLQVSDPLSLQQRDTMDATELTESPTQLLAEFRKTKRIPTSELLTNLQHKAHLAPRQFAQFSTEFHSRISSPLACLVVFLIGIPFGVTHHRQSGFLAIVFALIIFFAHWGLSETLKIFGENGKLSPWLAAWLPNILFSAAGIYKFRQIR